MNKAFLTLNQCKDFELVEKRSRFIGTACNVNSEDEAQKFIETIKSKNHDARHNCWAFVLDDQTCRYSDDGEPQGTAGMPILNVLLKRGLNNCALVVTRYFGGILLGTGGLTRAYSQTAAGTLDNSTVVQMLPFAVGFIVCDYNRYNRLRSLIDNFDGVLKNAEFADNATVELAVPIDRLERFRLAVTEFSNGDLTFEKTGVEFGKSSKNL